MAYVREDLGSCAIVVELVILSFIWSGMTTKTRWSGACDCLRS